MKGGVGKTTLATNICDCLNRRYGKKVLLIDIDPQFNSTQCMFSGDEYMEHLKQDKDTIITIFDDKTRSIAKSVTGISSKSSKPLNSIEPVKYRNDFHFLPGNLDLYLLEMSAGSGKEKRLKRFLDEIQKKEKYDFIFIDTPPTPSVWMSSAIIASDYYLVPVKAEPISYVGIDLLQAVIENKKEDLNPDIECIGLVLTMVERRGDSINYKMAVKEIDKRKWKKYKYTNFLPKRDDISKYQLNKTFILDLGDGYLKTCLSGIVEELIKRAE